MLKSFLVILSLLSISGSWQDDQTLSGTFIYGSVCKDGIVFISDSRANFKDKGKSQFYFDHVKKLFVVNEFVIAFSGGVRINNQFPHTFLSELENYNSDSPIVLIKNFTIILKKALGENKYNEVIENLGIFAGGYDKKRRTPLVCGLQNGKIYYNNRGTITNHNFSRLNTTLKKLNFKRSIKLMKKDIDNYTSDHKLNWEIGGPKTVITITKDSYPLCRENCDNLVWNNWTEAKQYIRTNIENISLTGCESKYCAMQILNKHR